MISMSRRGKKPKTEHIDVRPVDSDGGAKPAREPRRVGPKRRRAAAGKKSGLWGLLRRGGARAPGPVTTIHIDESGAPTADRSGRRPASGGPDRLGDPSGPTPLPLDDPSGEAGEFGSRFGRLRDAAREPLQRLAEAPRNLLDRLGSFGERFRGGPGDLLDTLKNSRALWIGVALIAVAGAGFAGFRLGVGDVISIRPGPEDLLLPTIVTTPGDAPPNGQTGPAGETYLWPVEDVGRISSCFGPRTLLGAFSNHSGLDIAVPAGTPVIASRSGVVVRARVSSSPIGYGTVAVLGHADGSFTLYAHMLPELNLVRAQQIPQGAILGFSGNTGFSTGPHLHFEVIDPSGTPQNPAEFLSQRWSDANIFNHTDAECWPEDIIGAGR